MANLTADQSTIDYLDKPPQRYTVDFSYGRYYFEPNATGDWVKFADMDAYMFEGAQLMQQAMAKNQKLRDALMTLLPGLVLDLRYANEDDDKDAMRSRIETIQEALR